MSDDSSERFFILKNESIFIENNAPINKPIATKIPSRINGRFICTDCFIIKTKVDVIHLVRDTVYNIAGK